MAKTCLLLITKDSKTLMLKNDQASQFKTLFTFVTFVESLIMSILLSNYPV